MEDWKTQLVQQLEELKEKTLGSDKIWIGLSLENPDRQLLFDLQKHVSTVNSRPVAWVGAGYLQLLGVTWQPGWAWITFALSPTRKFNECFVEDVLTGQVGKCELPLYSEVDFLAL